MILVLTMQHAAYVMEECAMRLDYRSSVTAVKKIYMESSVLTVSRHET